jgi:hypothetical protein
MTTPTDVRNQIISGQNFHFTSFRQKGRIYTVSAIIRPLDGNLFLIKASDLKNSVGLYNMENILPIIENALNNKQQCNFRIR